MCAALMGTNLHEIPAGEFFRFLKYSSKGSRFGLAIRGNGEMMNSLGDAMEKRGSRILTHARCERIITDNGRVTGVDVHIKNGEALHIEAEYVISNTGPNRTVDLVGGEKTLMAALY